MGDGDDDDEEEEEEEDAQPQSSQKGKRVVHSASAPSLRPAFPEANSTSPRPSAPPQPPAEDLRYASRDQSHGSGPSKVRVVRQWAPRGTTAQA